MEVKTLKDLFGNDRHEFKPASYGCSCGSCSEGCFGSCAVVILKQEAIKWVKDMALGPNGESWDKAIYSFMKFFNLTEEDLK